MSCKDQSLQVPHLPLSRLLRSICNFRGLLLAGSFFGLSACGPSAGEEPAPPLLQGEIVEVVAERNALVVRHGEIPGFLRATATEFVVGAGDVAIATVGRRIQGRAIESAGTLRLEGIWPVDPDDAELIEERTRRLREDTANRGSRALREVGESAPVFALYDQNGQVVEDGRFRGRHVLINFIFTRCPSPTMCPASTQRMIQLQRAAKNAGIENFELVSISLDPGYDTPGVLWQYAKSLSIDTTNFSFLTGPEEAIADLMGQFGIQVDRSEGLASHSLGTILVDEHGVIRHRVTGSDWMILDFLEKILALQDSQT